MRKLAPKFLLSAVETTQTASVRYYPNLLNGQNSRTTAAWRIFDIVSLAWLINMFRLCIFFGLIYFVVYFANISGSWGYIFFSVLLYSELAVHTVYSFFTNFSTGFVVLCCYSLCWYPVFLMSSTLLIILPAFLFAKRFMYVWILVIGCALAVQNAVRLRYYSNVGGLGIKNLFFVRKLMCQLLFVVLVVYLLVPSLVSILFFFMVWVIQSVYSFFRKVDACGLFQKNNLSWQVLDVLVAMRQLGIWTWCAGWFGQAQSYQAVGTNGNCGLVLVGLQRIDFVFKQVLIDLLRTGLQFRNFFTESRLCGVSHAYS